ncbi:2-C-methyl-D-erythritol 2,4-cyclodiphosphate synthase [Methylophilaceae bacterium]|jgi:2-C-methyl-D-erythritol 2,4-cyclodiphosphate synthase|nr:2-C-methyl-D-erythritol 2,4-cyclodiphosphate synthase [Methylophilaceae bacterium]|tara:strand:- start:946 stop:1422 length:477 start_codon:yes stop_codon:yes gene_type:complete
MARIGQGLDVHKFVSGRPLIIGGVKIDYKYGLEGHSDADVLIHAIIDSLLGAAGLGDIGQHFPDTDEAFKDINSRKLLRTVVESLKSNNYAIGNIDATIICETPKLQTYITQMTANISDDCNCDLNDINIKATTTEKLGFIGRSEGIGAQAICLIRAL